MKPKQTKTPYDRLSREAKAFVAGTRVGKDIIQAVLDLPDDELWEIVKKDYVKHKAKEGK